MLRFLNASIIDLLSKVNDGDDFNTVNVSFDYWINEVHLFIIQEIRMLIISWVCDNFENSTIKLCTNHIAKQEEMEINPPAFYLVTYCNMSQSHRLVLMVPKSFITDHHSLTNHIFHTSSLSVVNSSLHLFFLSFQVCNGKTLIKWSRNGLPQEKILVSIFIFKGKGFNSRHSWDLVRPLLLTSLTSLQFKWNLKL